MAKKKSIIEEALLDISKIQESLNANTKEILRSVAKEEIDALVRESINEADDDYEEEDVEDTTSMEDMEGMGDDMEGSEGYEDESGEEEMDVDMDMEVDDIDGDMDDYDTIDMTATSNDDAIAVYKKLGDNDEIEYVSDNEVNITDPESGNEYHVKLGGGAASVDMDDADMSMDMDAEFDMDDADMDDDMGDDDMEDDVVYDVTLDGEESDEEEDEDEMESDEEEMESDEEEMESDEVEMESDEDEDEVEEGLVQEKIQVGKGRNVTTKKTAIEGAGGKANNVKRPNVTTNENLVRKYNAVLTEAKKLKQENIEFKQALGKFRTMLAETVVFNSNLTYVTKLFTEHATTKGEKEEIIKRFDDEVSTIKESKTLYKTIARELSKKKPINESVTNRFNQSKTGGVSKTNLNESTAYVDESTKRIIDLMNRVEEK